jgi:hypothetical protein
MRRASVTLIFALGCSDAALTQQIPNVHDPAAAMETVRIEPGDRFLPKNRGELAEHDFPMFSGQCADTFTQVDVPLDVLFVVDNTASMSEEQNTLAANAATFTSWATQSGLDWQAAVITTDVEDTTNQAGRFQGSPLIVDASTPPETLAANLLRGTSGSTNTRGLEAIQLALSSPLLETFNAGFLRANAALAIIVLSDGRDVSRGAPAIYESFIFGLKTDPSLLVVNSIAGDTAIGCSGANGVADPSERYFELTAMTEGEFVSICANDWSPALTQIGATKFGLRNVFFLSSSPSHEILEVEVDGIDVPSSNGAKWSFDATVNAVVFTTAATPPAGASIVIRYQNDAC